MIKNSMDNMEEQVEVRGVSRIKKTGAYVAAVFLMILAFAASGCTGGGNNADLAANIPAPEVPAPDSAANMPDSPASDDVVVEPGSAEGVKKPAKSEKSKAKNKNKKDSAAGDDVDVIASQNDKMVVMKVENTGRMDPFMPASEAEAKRAEEAKKNSGLDLEKAKLQYDLVDPPNSSNADSDAEKILSTKVSGIMYDSDSPSAILNIEGSDYLVRSGDVVNGYKVLSIQPTIVTVQLGANVYQAGVGQLLVTDGIQYNTVSNLDKKFGGAKK